MYNDSVLYLFRIVNRETIQRLFQAHTDQFKNPYSFKTKLLRHKGNTITPQRQHDYNVKATRLRCKGNAITA